MTLVDDYEPTEEGLNPIQVCDGRGVHEHPRLQGTAFVATCAEWAGGIVYLGAAIQLQPAPSFIVSDGWAVIMNVNCRVYREPCNVRLTRIPFRWSATIQSLCRRSPATSRSSQSPSPWTR
jgi:hypothetical protein